MDQINKSNFEFRQIFDTKTCTFTYLVFDAETREGIIIDPIRENFSKNLKYIEELEIDLR